MTYFTIAIMFFFIVILFLIIVANQKSKKNFLDKIYSLEQIIDNLKLNLDLQSQKIKLSEDLKNNMRQSNNILSSKIVDMNLEMFQEMFPKKNL